MNVLLVQLDGKMPNLALMKLSSWHKAQGDVVALNNMENPDIVYVSCIFEQNKNSALSYIDKYPNAQVHIGGSGVDLKLELPYEIEHMMPDYDLYNIDYSIGFTSRGCIRKCDFCIVPDKEGYMTDWAPISEFLHPTHKKLILFDNNFLASPKWKENLEFLIENKIKVNFNQGLDIRLINEHNASLLAKTKIYDWRFKRRCLHFAFDHPNMEEIVIKGLNILFKSGIKPYKLMFYVLIGYDTTFDEDYRRFKILTNFGVDPYIMLYNDRRDKPLLRHFERWVNARIYKVSPFEEYKVFFTKRGRKNVV